ncbi:uncharacterized protein LOC115880379 [Sitophilus oryzae]|uniref:Uncharacterized protein LOC115880379 n=1 Tax=Sitophilus oryzae TaxID=7048 RepID=A0A6J2XS52_SITOR|nr:uncharacterized protein LOC115880379 [Sitophilus oryzae]
MMVFEKVLFLTVSFLFIEASVVIYIINYPEGTIPPQLPGLNGPASISPSVAYPHMASVNYSEDRTKIPPQYPGLNVPPNQGVAFGIASVPNFPCPGNQIRDVQGSCREFFN